MTTAVGVCTDGTLNPSILVRWAQVPATTVRDAGVIRHERFASSEWERRAAGPLIGFVSVLRCLQHKISAPRWKLSAGFDIIAMFGRV